MLRKKSIFIIIIVYLLFLIPIFMYNLSTLYKNEDVFLYVSKENGSKINYSFMLDFKINQKISNFSYYMIKDIDAKVIHSDIQYDTIIRGWYAFTYFNEQYHERQILESDVYYPFDNRESYIDFLKSEFSTANNKAKLILNDNSYVIIYPPIIAEAPGFFGDLDNYTVFTNEDVLLYNRTAKLILKNKIYDIAIEPRLGQTTLYHDYRRAVNDNLLSENVNITFASYLDFLEYYTLNEDGDIKAIERKDFLNIEFDGSVIKFSTHQIKYRDIMNFIKNFENNGYVVKRNISSFEKNYYFIKIAYICIVTVIMITIIIIVKRKENLEKNFYINYT